MSPSTSPRVTIAVPVYNSASTLERALRSALRQTLSDIEILVLDDGSTDDGAAIVERLAHSLDPWSRECEVTPASLLTSIVGPDGRLPPSSIRPECEMAPELLRTGVM